ncbi:hypothetical protein LP422_17665 [Janibacter limosus]|uniref:Uncharacterized protein n=1 Tax=Janibacter limosus TaxID=53458 RepID=A0AC61U2P0_9MICO|nr:hypothetical protein [Janibacter limosus]UUZ44289.1 hypothetical protein LP422_17665 [Janibacter limosus]
MDDTEIGLEPLGRPSAGEALDAVTQLLWTAGGIGMAEATRGEYDVVLGSHALRASLAAPEAADLLNLDVRPSWGGPGSNCEDFFALVAEAEQVLAGRPIDQWPRGTSHLIVSVCDLIGNMRDGGLGPHAR